MALKSGHTIRCSARKGEDAQSVKDRNQEETADSMWIIAMSLKKLEVFYVLHATCPSENSNTTLPSFKQR